MIKKGTGAYLEWGDELTQKGVFGNRYVLESDIDLTSNRTVLNGKKKIEIS